MLSFLKMKIKEEPIKELRACVSGKVIPMEAVNDPVFSSKAMGDGVGIEPSGNLIVAPCNGKISVVMDTSKHALGITLNNGAEILIHVGIDSVSMEGEGFKLFVNKGDTVKEGDRLIQFDPELIHSKGFESTCIVALTNGEEFSGVEFMTGIEAEQGRTVIVRFP